MSQPKPTKVFIVTDGSYDDYEIKAVFFDESLAEIYAARHEYDRIEPHDVYDEKSPNLNSMILSERSNDKLKPKKLYHARFINNNFYIEWRYTLRDVDTVYQLHPGSEVSVQLTFSTNTPYEEAEKKLKEKYNKWKGETENGNI